MASYPPPGPGADSQCPEAAAVSGSQGDGSTPNASASPGGDPAGTIPQAGSQLSGTTASRDAGPGAPMLSLQEQQEVQPGLAPRPPAAAVPSSGAASGRPPLKRLVPPSSATSSRASSPRSSMSIQPGNTAKLAQYLAGPRAFKPDGTPRRGLGNGDVVALSMQGKLLAVTQLGTEPELGTVHYALQPSEQATPADKLTHLEVVKQGKWLGFRSAAAGDRFLQARKRSPNRLVFFSANVGTWEQWELGPGATDPDATDWASLALMLRHRRLPQFELEVEVVRVGTVTLPPNSAVTPRTLLAGGATELGLAAGEEDAAMERRELKRMSGVLVHEWLHYVDQEKAARLAVEARLAQMAEDAAGLRDWAVMQVESVRREMDEEVQMLLEAVKRKSAKLVDAESRLTGRLRWGVAMIQARTELNTKRQVFMWWRWIAARKKYCSHVESKLQQRANLRLAARALAGWLEYRERQAAMCAQLRAAVRRMSFVKLYHAFTAWQDLVAYKQQQAEDHAALVEAVCQHMQRWRLRRLLRGWQQHTAGCAAGRAQLQRMACQAEQRLVASALGAWRAHVAQQAERVATFSAMVAVRQRQRAQAAAFQGWRVAVDDEYGARLQLQHAQQVLARMRVHAVFLAWREWRQLRDSRRQRWEAVVTYMRQRLATAKLDAAWAAWQHYVAAQKEERVLFFNAVEQMALRKMTVAFQAWRYLTAYRQHARAALEQGVERLARRRLVQAFVGWQQHVADRRVERHRIAVCQRRQQLGVLRGTLAGWRQVAALRGAERQIVQLCQRRADRNRMGIALAAFRANADAAAARREQDRLAVCCYAGSLQARAFAAMADAVDRQRLFEARLAAVAHNVQQAAVREAFSGWRSAAALSTSEGQLVAAAHRRIARMRLQSCLRSWREVVAARQQHLALLQRHLQQRAARMLGATFAAWQQHAEREQDLQQRLCTCVARTAQMRMAWALDVWRHVAAAKAAKQQMVAAGQRRVARVRLVAAFDAWQQHTADLAAAWQVAEQMAADRQVALLRECLLGWADYAAHRAQQATALVQLVQRRASWMGLNVLHFWRAYVAHCKQQRLQLQRVTRKLAAVCQRHAFAAWRQHTAWQRSEALRLEVAGQRIATRHAGATLAATFREWRSHTATLAAARAAVDAKVAAEGAVVRRHVITAWRSYTYHQAVRHDHILRVCVGRQCTLLQSKALVSWQLFAQRQAHNREVVELMVHRMARRVMHAALLSWRQAAQERRVRRTALARFIQRWDAHRKAAALAHWRRLLAERHQAEDNLRRCLMRKRVAFRLFRQWYWESFDDDMQETLRTMFEITEGAAVDPLPSRAGSPYGSLLSSPIRQQVYGMPRQQQQQLTTGVAEALARPGALQPAFLRGVAAGPQLQQDSGSASLGTFSSLGVGMGMGLPQLPPREPLHSRLDAAARAMHSTASPGAAAAAASNLGGHTLAPLRQFAAFTLHHNAMSALETVPEGAESPYMARSPAGVAAMAAAQLSQAGGAPSSTASTVLPGGPGGSPLTPASAFLVGSSPLPTGASRLPTPGDAASLPMSATRQFSGLLAAPTPGGTGFMSSCSQQELAGSALRYAGTPQSTDFALASPAALGSAASRADISPQAAQRYTDAATPLGMQHTQYEIRKFSDGTEYLAAAGTPLGAAPADAGMDYHTPLAAQKTPPPGLLELQGDYSIRRLGAAAEEEGRRLAGEATPRPEALIGAFPGSAARGSATGGGNAGEGGLSAAKTPVLHVNPLAL